MSFHDHKASLRYGTMLETKAEGDEPDVAKAIGDLTAAFETKMTALDTELKAQKDRADALEIKLNRPGQNEQKDAPTLEQKAFDTYLRRGRDVIGADEIKTLRVADDAAGGFLAPAQVDTALIRELVQFSPMRAAARVGTMSAPSIKLAKLTERIAAQWVTEISERPEDEPRFGQAALEAHEMAVVVPVSNQLLEDSVIDLEAELRFEFGQAFALLEGTAFTSGDGVGKPIGIMTDPAVQEIPNGSNAAISPDGLLALLYSLPSFYRNRGSWMLNGPTIGKIRGLKDSTGRFLWADALTEGQPPTLLGRPVIEAIDMPDATANATPILFGDFATAYRVYDRVGLSVLRDPYSRAKFGQTLFHARRRVAGAVIQPAAVRKLKMAAS